MTATTTARGLLVFDADHYLDRRPSGWESYERRGLIRFERPLGSRRALVLVDADCVEVVATLQAPMHRCPVPSK
jgi:hypothetical protein